MVLACILVYCEAGKFKEVLDKVKGLEGVKRAFPVHGRCDLVIQAGATDLKKLGELAFKVAATPGVRATETLVEVPL